MAVDGITGAGKSTAAAELTAAVASRGVPAVHLSTDDFHHVAAHRRRDPDRARGYYRDAYDLATFRRLVLEPLADGRPYVPRSHDLESDALLEPEPQAAHPGAVVVVDGTFLQGRALRGAWDVVVWLDTSFPEAERRAVLRDADLLGGADAARAAYRDRYHAACRLYIDEVHPQDSADLVLRNDDLAAPVLTVRRPRGAETAAPR